LKAGTEAETETQALGAQGESHYLQPWAAAYALNTKYRQFFQKNPHIAIHRFYFVFYHYMLCFRRVG
jgi:hypothetical protein